MAQWVKVTITKPDKSKFYTQDPHGERSMTLTDVLIYSHIYLAAHVHTYIYKINECTF